jgi:hypothetical protein
MVKCADCGYLGMRHCKSQALVCPSAKHRSSGEPPVDESIRIAPINRAFAVILDFMPVCAIGVSDLHDEFASRQGHVTDWSQEFNSSVSAAKKVMQKDRPECQERFTPWIPGLTPKEHIDMLATREMLNAQATRAEAQAAREREWRKEDVMQARQWHDTDVQHADQLGRKHRKAVIGAALIGLFGGVLIAVLSAWITKAPQPDSVSTHPAATAPANLAPTKPATP